MNRVRLRDPVLPVTALGCLVFALVAGGRYPFYSFYLLTLVTACSWVWARSLAASLRVTYTADRLRLTTADAAVVELRLSNEGFLPAPWVRINDSLLSRWVRLPAEDGGRELPPESGPPGRFAPRRNFTRLPHDLFWLGPLGARLIHLQVERLPRGHYRLGPMEMEARDPLGIFSVRGSAAGRSVVTVYPAISPLAGLAIPAGQSFGPLRTREKAQEDLSSLSQVRPFRPGDSPKLIHWRVTARKNSLHSREYDRTTTVQLMLFLDLCRGAERPGADGFTTTDLGAEVAASLAFHAWSRGYEFGLAGHGPHRVWLPAGKGLVRFEHLLEALARVQASGEVPLGQVLARESRHLVPRATVVAITPAVSGDLAGTLAQLRRRGFNLMLVRLRGQDDAGEAALLGERWREAAAAAGARVYEVSQASHIGRVLGGRDYRLDGRRISRHAR